MPLLRLGFCNVGQLIFDLLLIVEKIWRKSDGERRGKMEDNNETDTIDSQELQEIDDDNAYVDNSPDLATVFFGYLQSKEGHELATTFIDFLQSIKAATLDRTAEHAKLRLEKDGEQAKLKLAASREYNRLSIIQQTVVFGVAITAICVLTYYDKLNPTASALISVIVGYLFGKKTSE